jgi:hypothetical protein
VAEEVARLRAQRDAGIENAARAALAALDALTPFLRITGRDVTEAGHLALAIRSYAASALEELAALPGWEKTLAAIGSE